MFREGHILNTKNLSLLALFIALSIVGSMIKIPAVVGSVALDAFPALVAVVLIGGKSGAWIAALGHLMSALIGGMPLGPMHGVIAVEMALIVWVFGMLYQSNRKLLAGASFVFLNGLIAPLPFIILLSFPFYLSLLPSLLIGSVVNMVLAWIAIPRLEPLFHKDRLETFHGK